MTPRRFGPYVVERELARGGMGVVYQVLHEETGARYALKTIARPGGALDEEDLLRFQREADLLARLDHPGIVKVHSAGVEGQVAYLVQALLPGGSLQARLEARRVLPRDEAVALVAALADAVAHAHAHGVLHRDLKPQNVLFDERGRPVLVDFGLGRDLERDERLTATGTMLGTPGYMAPEQAKGERADDPRTDVYGLGAVLFALLTGQPPFTGGGLGLLARIAHDPAPALTDLDPDAPPALAATVARCLAKRLEDRPPSAAALAAALREPSAPNSSPALRRVAAAGAVALALLAGALGLRAIVPPPPAPTSAAAPPSPAPAAGTPTPAEPATPDPAWTDAAQRVDDDPERAWEVLATARGAPPPEAARVLRAASARQIEALSREARATRISARLLTPATWKRWLACLRIQRRVQGRVPPELVSGLTRLLGWQRGTESVPYVTQLLDLLADQEPPPRFAASFMQFYAQLTRIKLLALAPRAERLADAVPMARREERVDVHANLCQLFAGIHDFRRALPKERPRLHRVLARAKVIDFEVRREARVALLQAQARASLGLGRPRRAMTFAERGWKTYDDVACRGLMAAAAHELGGRHIALEMAHDYLERARHLIGKVLYDHLLGILWDLESPRIRQEIDRLLGAPSLQQRTEFHGWRLRAAYLRLRAGELAEGRALLQQTLAEVRRTVTDQCHCYSVHPQLLRLRPDSGADALKPVIDALDQRRAWTGAGVP